jgi:hypothetical protein
MSDELELERNFEAVIHLCALVVQERPGWWPALVEWDQFQPAYRLRFSKGWGLAWVTVSAPFDLPAILTSIDQADAYHTTGDCAHVNIELRERARGAMWECSTCGAHLFVTVDELVELREKDAKGIDTWVRERLDRMRPS